MGKRLETANKNVDRTKLHSLVQAAEIVKKNATAKFDETVEIHVRLGVDPKQSDQNVRGTVNLPNGIGKTKKVVVIAKGEKVKEAEAAGADLAGDADVIEKIGKGWMEFDVLVATPDVMKDLTKLGKVLGPKGLMPNPKAGTVTFDVARAVKETKAGKIEFRVDKAGNVQAPIGKVSFSADALETNFSAFMDQIIRSKPAAAKGVYVKTVAVSSTMGPGVRIDTNPYR